MLKSRVQFTSTAMERGISMAAKEPDALTSHETFESGGSDAVGERALDAIRRPQCARRRGGFV